MNISIGDINKKILTSERLQYDMVTEKDMEDMYEYSSSETTTKFLKWGPHKCITETIHFYDRIIAVYHSGNELYWAIREKNSTKLIGIVRIYNIKDRQAEISYILNEKYWNKGYMTETLKYMIDFCFDHMKLIKVITFVLRENIASEMVIKKSGMVINSKFNGNYIKLKSGEDVELLQYEILNKNYNI